MAAWQGTLTGDAKSEVSVVSSCRKSDLREFWEKQSNLFCGGSVGRIRFRRADFCLILFLAIAHSPAFAGKKAPKIAETIDLPSSFDVDFQFAAKQRVELGPQKEVPDDAAGRVGTEVFQSLVKTEMISGFGLPYAWTFKVSDNPAVNAFSLADGEVVAFTGLSRLIGTNRGLWAAVLSHEIGHVARRHAAKKYLFHRYVQEQVRYWQMRAQMGDRGAAWAALGVQVAGNLAEKKLSRDMEHDADIQGMLLMARAGYHPDYSFAMHHLLRMGDPERSRIGTFFFSDHPRWETRDQRTDRAYTEALAEYNRLWETADASPGGAPPSVAFLGDVRGLENKAGGTGDLTLALSCRNVERPVGLVIRLTKGDGSPVQTTASEYRDSVGNALIYERAACLDRDGAKPTIVHIPAAIIHGQERKLKAQVEVVGSDGILERSKVFDVHFPKAARQNSTILAKVRVEPELGEKPGEGADQDEIAHAAPRVPIPAQIGSDAVSEAATHVEQPKASAAEVIVATRSGDSGAIVQVAPDAIRPALPAKRGPLSAPSSETLGLLPSALDDRGLPSNWANRLAPTSSGTWWQVSQAAGSVNKIDMSRSAVFFPVQQVDTNSLPTRVVITNSTSAAMMISGLTFAGTDATDFRQSNDCGSKIEAGATCTVSLTFRPTANGTRRGVLTVNGTTQEISLTGIGK
jgi:hypothetical protein